MSGPPGSQVVDRKKKKSNSGRPAATNKDSNSDHKNTNKSARNSMSSTQQPIPQSGATTPGMATPAPPTASSSPSFQHPRQQHLYVEPIPLRVLYDQLLRGDRQGPSVSTSGHGGGYRKQSNSRRASLSLQRTFTQLPYPRGMMNNSNFCFMNSILQALLFIPPFTQLAVSVSCDAQAQELCPVLAAFGKWALQYWKPGFTRLAAVAPTLLSRNGGRDAEGKRSSPARRLDGSQQEDAQEFLQKLLEQIQQELIQLEETLESGPAGPGAGLNETGGVAVSEKGWTVVKGKERLTVRTHNDVGGRSFLLSAIFGGTLESHLQGKQRQRDRVSVLVEGYFCLPVDIAFAAESSIEQALEYSFTAEHIYDSEREKNLTKTLRLGTLPAILLLQLRRWAVTREGQLVKLDNTVHLRRTLILPRIICSDESLSNADRSYRLLSVVCHRGDAMGQGHYVTFLVDHTANPEIMKVQQASGKGGGESEAARPAPAPTSIVLCNDTNLSLVPAQSMEKEAVYFLVYQKTS